MAGANLSRVQAGLFAVSETLPEGLRHRPEVLPPADEAELARRFAALPFANFQFHGFEGKRRTISYGWHYAFDGSGLRRSEPVPDFLLPARGLAAAFAGLEADALEHVLIVEYAPGAGIGWHRDRPVFGDVVALSLLAAADIRFRRRDGARWQRATLPAAPRSAYLLTGPARWEWEHSIVPIGELRYSITFRTLRAEVAR